jgi:SAM-dependent methyltransferase
MLLRDCFDAGLEPGRFAQIIERSDGFIDCGDPLRYFAAEPWTEAEAVALREARGRVLDVGAGAGRLALYLQSRGLEVMALDISRLAVEVCIRRGVRQTFVGSAEDLARQGAAGFDTILLAGGNLGLIRDPDYAMTFMGALASLARPGATVIGNGMDPYRTQDPDHLAYHAANRALGRAPGQLTIRVRHRRHATDWFDLLFTSVAELEEVLERTPWTLDGQTQDGGAYHALIRRR